jgi:hypothetical protein
VHQTGEQKMHNKPHILTLLAVISLSGAAQANLVTPYEFNYYEERSTTSSDPTNIRTFDPHTNASTRYTSSRTGDGGGTAEQVSFGSTPAPYVFARAEAWNAGGVVALVPGSGFVASLSYGFTVIGPANGLIPIRFEGRYGVTNDSFVSQTYAGFAMSVSGMDYSRPDQVGMHVTCSGSYDSAYCNADTRGHPSVNGSIQVNQRLLGFDPTFWGITVDGRFSGVLMAPTDDLGLAQGLVSLYVEGGASGFRDYGISGVSSAFIDPALSIDSDYLAAFPEARLLLTPGVGNQMVAFAVPEPDSWAMLLAGLGLIGVVARRRRG